MLLTKGKQHFLGATVKYSVCLFGPKQNDRGYKSKKLKLWTTKQWKEHFVYKPVSGVINMFLCFLGGRWSEQSHLKPQYKASWISLVQMIETVPLVRNQDEEMQPEERETERKGCCWILVKFLSVLTRAGVVCQVQKETGCGAIWGWGLSTREQK